MLLSECNKSGVTFTLSGFSDYPEVQLPLFFVFLSIYGVAVVGNIGMIVIMKINPKLHTPMYFFLSHLSFVVFCYSSVVAPKILENLVVEDRAISLLEWVVQLFFFRTFIVTESFLLSVMAYDCFLAICNTLLYTIAMSHDSLLLFIFVTLNDVITLLIILTSYMFIIVTILKMSSASGHRKVFSTCASHLTAITLFHGTILFLYCVPNPKTPDTPSK
ncbi:olfactory receptor 5D18-like [Loxodonta africana]|uniref:olfactory receptor 5D18-like n=1 Tax=Loxodonta africana TaxID=9785 RepID=UPI0030D2C758